MQNSKEKILNVKLEKTTAKLNEKVNIVLEISCDYGFVDSAEILINQQKSSNEQQIKMNYLETKNNINYFICNIDFHTIGLHYFCIKIILNNELKWIKNDVENNSAVLTENDFPYWTITVYDNNFEVPNWAKGKIMYHIMVDRFYKSKNYLPIQMPNRVSKKWGKMPNWKINSEDKYCNNEFFMGNLKGIEEKINYLKELGIEIIYLSPICRSQSNHRYDVSDYENVDPYLGENKDLQNLCNTAHKNGMKIVVDAVFNHTGNDSKYFNEYNNYNTIGAFQSENSKYYKWYKKNSNGEFEYWWGFKNLPVCDGTNEEWQQYIYGENGIIDKWFALGIDGLRLDVADELTDEFIENIRIAVKRNKKDGFIIGEVWDNAITKEKNNKQRTYLLGKGLDSVMNYPYTNAILKYVKCGDFNYFVKTIQEILKMYPKETINSLMNSLSTHDITRVITTFATQDTPNSSYDYIWNIPYGREIQYKKDKLSRKEYNKSKELLKIATVIQYFLPGNPCIYYGDEVGVYGYKDPFNRKCFPWNKIDKEIHKFYVELGKIRKNIKFLRQAEINIIKINEDVLIFERYDKENKVMIAVNRSEKNVKIEIPEKYKNKEIIFENGFDGINLSKFGIVIIN